MTASTTNANRKIKMKLFKSINITSAKCACLMTSTISLFLFLDQEMEWLFSNGSIKSRFMLSIGFKSIKLREVIPLKFVQESNSIQ